VLKHRHFSAVDKIDAAVTAQASELAPVTQAAGLSYLGISTLWKLRAATSQLAHQSRPALEEAVPSKMRSNFQNSTLRAQQGVTAHIDPWFSCTRFFSAPSLNILEYTCWKESLWRPVLSAEMDI
jgi:hypothetical protein